jgi:cysteine desulfurase
MPVPQIQGGAQENDMRSGTENVAGTSASLTALRLSLGQMDNERRRLSGLSKRFLEMMSDKIDGYYINSDPDEGIPGLVSLSFKGVIGTNIVAEMDLEGFSLSAGSACHSGEVSPSRVILAMGRSEEAALGTVRVSMGRFTDEEQVGQLASCLSEVVERQRALA